MADVVAVGEQVAEQLPCLTAPDHAGLGAGLEVQERPVENDISVGAAECEALRERRVDEQFLGAADAAVVLDRRPSQLLHVLQGWGCDQSGGERF